MMHDFFRGWRRKTGCVTLALACAVFLIWMRSYVVEDRLAFNTGGFRYAIGSFQGTASWDHWLDSTPTVGVAWSSEWRNLSTPMNPRPRYYRARPGTVLGGVQFESRAVPYWPLLWPLTLLSAFLIFWRPRKP